MALLDKKNLEHLAELARIDLSEDEEVELVKDLEKILAHFNELKELDTAKIEPLIGGAWEVNVFREDEPERTSDTGKGNNQFPEVEKGYLKVPPVF